MILLALAACQVTPAVPSEPEPVVSLAIDESPAPRPSIPLRLGGRVVRMSDGSSLQGVTVELLAERDAPEPTVLSRTSTWEDGSFLFTGDGPKAKALRLSWAPEGPEDPEAVPEPTIWHARLAADTAGRHDLLVVLDSGWDLTGQVLDERGRGVRSAELLVEPVGRSATADAEGRFVVHDLPRGDVPLTALVKAIGFQLRRLPVTAPLDEAFSAELPVTIERGGMIYGVVTMPRPVRPAHPPSEVTAISHGPLPADLVPGDFVVSTSRHGSYRIDGLPPGGWSVQCLAEVSAVASHAAYASGLEVPVGRPVQVNFTVPGPASLSGRLHEAGRALVGHRIELWHALPLGGDEQQLLRDATTVTDEQGGFVLDGLAPGRKELRVLPPDEADETVLMLRQLELGEAPAPPVELDLGG
jgi:protocatechuate 3,4-dioxygenase beta subunit